MSDKKNEIWIGLVDVRPLPDSEILKDASGAYVNVLTWAVDAEEYRAKVGELMDYLHLMVTGIENPEPLSNRGRTEEFDSEVAKVAQEVQQNPDAIMYCTFHSWAAPST